MALLKELMALRLEPAVAESSGTSQAASAPPGRLVKTEYWALPPERLTRQVWDGISVITKSQVMLLLVVLETCLSQSSPGIELVRGQSKCLPWTITISVVHTRKQPKRFQISMFTFPEGSPGVDSNSSSLMRKPVSFPTKQEAVLTAEDLSSRAQEGPDRL